MLPCGTFNKTYGQAMATIRTPLQWGLFIVFLTVLLALPAFAAPALLDYLIIVGIFVIAVLGLNIVMGLCGQISLGQAAFMAIGGYTAGILAVQGMPWLLALVVGIIASGAAGFLFGLPSLRVKGFYLLVATAAAHFIITWIIIFPAEHWSGGFDGMNVPFFEAGGFVFSSTQSLYWLVISFAILATFAAKNISRTRLGRAFIAIRDNDLAAEVMGINVFRYKVIAFVISAMFGGLAGGLLGAFLSSLAPDTFNLMEAIWMLGMLIVGGSGSTLGVILGVVFLKGLKQLTWMYGPALYLLAPDLFSADIYAAIVHVLFGLVIILFLIYEPRGLSHRWEIIKMSSRLHPFSY